MKTLRLFIGTLALALGLNSMAAWASKATLNADDDCKAANRSDGTEGHEPPCLGGG